MTVEIILWSISTEVWDRVRIKLTTPGSAVGLSTNWATRPGNYIDSSASAYVVYLRNKETQQTFRVIVSIHYDASFLLQIIFIHGSSIV